MRDNRKFLLKFFAATSLLALFPLGVARWQENQRRNAPKMPYTFPFAELAALDNVVQARFAVVPTDDFGMGRVGKRHAYFTPVTSEEQRAVDNLRGQIYFFVAGRRMLLKKHGPDNPHAIHGPVVMAPGKPLKASVTTPQGKWSNSPISFQTPGKMPPDLPSETQLAEVAARVLDGFYEIDGAARQIGRWEVVMTPVRATKQECADCHNHEYRPRDEWLYIGDTLGVAMYAYRRKDNSPPRRGDAEER